MPQFARAVSQEQIWGRPWGPRTAEIVPPQWTDLILTTNIPDVEFDILVRDSLDVEADGGDSSDVLAQLELVEDGGLSGGIKT